jgi:four helix bundle protein
MPSNEKKKPFDMEDRLVEFAADCALFSISIFGSAVGNYYGNQLLRSSGGAALNYGEAQGVNANKDFVHKASIVLKELKESRINLKISLKMFEKNSNQILELKNECEQLAAIIATMIKNRNN